MTDIIRDHVNRLMKAQMIHDDAIVRSLLEQWVSELEPSVAYHNGEVIGLCLADAELDSVPWIFNPLGALA